MNLEVIKEIVNQLDFITQSLSDEELIDITDYFIQGCVQGIPYPEAGKSIVENLVTLDVIDEWILFQTKGIQSTNTGIVNMVRFHLIQLAYFRFKSIVKK